MSSTIIVGAGWAGLSCAAALVKSGHKVTLIDAAPQTGGRARGVQIKDHILDNGQHICLGAYHTLRQMLRELGLDEQKLFHILPLSIIIHGTKKIDLRAPSLSGILLAKNISWLEKYQLMKFFYRLRKMEFSLQEDCSVLTLLKNYQQSDFIIKNLWEPLTLAAMTTPITQASARVFLKILSLSFNQGTENSNWYLPVTDLSSILPTHISDYLAQHHAEIIPSQTIKQLHLVDGKCTGVSSKNKNWQADNIVLAIAPWQVMPLLEPHPELNSTHEMLNNFCYEPITTIYFAFPSEVKLGYPIVGTLNTTCHWVFDRAFANQPKIISAVISGPGAHQHLAKDDLADLVLQDLRALFPHLPKPDWQRVITEKRAAFNCSVQIQKHRPQAQTAISNLWLTGDYLQTGLPATLEGALLSGRVTAQNISPRSNQNC